jgi:FkbH-like protein
MDGAGVRARPDRGPGELLELQRTGRLAAEYPLVRGLLADASGGELARAGRVLERLDPEDVLCAHPATPTMTVAVTGHGTLSALRTAMTAELARHGLLMRSYFGDFDGYVFDLGDPGSALYAVDPDLVLCVLDPMIVFDEVPAPWRPDDVERVLDDKLRLVEGLAAKFAAKGRGCGCLVLNTLPLPRRFTAQLLDHRSRARLGAAWREANARLLRLAADHPALVTLDLDPLLAEGVAATEPRTSVYAKAHLSDELLAAYAREAGHLARHLAGATKKTLVLDLDGTLWGGVVGEDGVDGIEVGSGYRGEAFAAFQRTVKQLAAQGVLVAAVSKNDAAPVEQALREHPEMVLREKDFVQVIANWRPKHDNLAGLATALNLGVDSFVFADDSAYECGLVRHALPGVAVVGLDAEPARHIERLLRDGWFDVRELTEEDQVRPVRYREELARQSFLDTFDSIEDYLRELDVTVRFAPVTEAETTRVAQLTLRTNQFNLTTERLQAAEIRARCADPDVLVLGIRAGDRFGDNGLVGVVLALRDDTGLNIANFLLSCRVFSRGIEQACLAVLLRHARATGAPAVFGTYRPTAKNGMVRDFYARNGFTELGDDGTGVTFRHDLTEIAAPPEHVRLATTLQGDTR